MIHNYRQAQTAITVQYFINKGINWAYQTPHMGYPWRVPMEFPLYQALVYSVQKITCINLVITGKLINILCHVINNVLLLNTARIISLKKHPLFIGLIFYNLFPFYLVFDSVFLPDGFTLTLAFISIYFLALYLNHKESLIYVFIYFFFTTLAGLSKSTTFASVLAPITFFLCLKYLNKDIVRRDKIFQISSRWRPFLLLA